METEELGSVYEGLLELTPRASADARTFAFAEGDETRGHARKTTGSYYTPEALVKLLLDATLDPVLDAAEARNPADPIAGILKLSILDPACGSGHFLLGAARRAAARIAKLRSPGAPSQIEFQHALREVVSRCIYGVDRNPLAVELCKVALWIEALEPGKPLTFLDARIRCGDSLIGVFDYAMLKDGIPDEAYKPLTGDDKDAARAWAKLNRGQRDGKAKDGMLAEIRPPAGLLDAARAIRRDARGHPRADRRQGEGARPPARRQLAAPQGRLRPLRRRLLRAQDRAAAARWSSSARRTMPLTDHVWRAAAGHQIYSRLFTEADRIAHAVHAFHWPLEFPDILARGGFDAVVGNPPWERIKLQEQEFFAARSPEIATAPNAAARGRLIQALAEAEEGTPERRLHDDFVFAKRAAEAAQRVRPQLRPLPADRHRRRQHLRPVRRALFPTCPRRAEHGAGALDRPGDRRAALAPRSATRPRRRHRADRHRDRQLDQRVLWRSRLVESDSLALIRLSRIESACFERHR